MLQKSESKNIDFICALVSLCVNVGLIVNKVAYLCKLGNNLVIVFSQLGIYTYYEMLVRSFANLVDFLVML